MLEFEPTREDLTDAVGFEEAIDKFPEEERELAGELAKIKDNAFNKDPLGVYNAFGEFYAEMEDRIKNSPIDEAEKDKKIDEVRNCQLRHVLGGSTLSPEEWEQLPLDTPNGDYQKFILEVLNKNDLR